MAKEQDFISAIDAVNNSGKSISFAELAVKIYKDKIVEVYVGDTFEDIEYDDSTQKYAAVLVGKVIKGLFGGK